MALSTKDIIDKLIHPELTRSNNEPDYISLSKVFSKIYANAAEVPSTLGGGNHGHLGAVMTATLYATLSPTPWADPADPGPNPTYPAGATAAQCKSIKDAWKRDTTVFTTHNNFQTVTKALIVKAFPKSCLAEICHCIRGLHGVLVSSILRHLKSRYGKIAEPVKQQAKKDFEEDYDPGQPISIYFQRIDDAVQLADDAEIPYTPAQITQQALFQMKKCGLYKDACKARKEKATADQTWDNLKTHFAEAYFDRKEETAIGGEAGFHETNRAEEHHQANVAEALDNLANAVTTDAAAMADLVAANKQLTDANHTLAEQLKVALEQNRALTKILEKGGGGGGGGN